MSLIIATGDDVAIPIYLTKNRASFTIDTGATVKAAITDKDRRKLLTTAVTCLSTDTGADWANSLVIATFVSAVTAILPVGSVGIEVQVDDVVNDIGKRSWFGNLFVRYGLIT